MSCVRATCLRGPLFYEQILAKDFHFFLDLTLCLTWFEWVYLTVPSPPGLLLFLPFPGRANKLGAIDWSINKNNHWHRLYSHHCHFPEIAESLFHATVIHPAFGVIAAKLRCTHNNGDDVDHAVHQSRLTSVRTWSSLHERQWVVCFVSTATTTNSMTLLIWRRDSGQIAEDKQKLLQRYF